MISQAIDVAKANRLMGIPSELNAGMRKLNDERRDLREQVVQMESNLKTNAHLVDDFKLRSAKVRLAEVTRRHNAARARWHAAGRLSKNIERFAVDSGYRIKRDIILPPLTKKELAQRNAKLEAEQKRKREKMAWWVK